METETEQACVCVKAETMNSIYFSDLDSYHKPLSVRALEIPIFLGLFNFPRSWLGSDSELEFWKMYAKHVQAFFNNNIRRT